MVKFLVRHGDAEPSDDVGDLNLTLANKLEVALILANTDEKFGVIDKASEQVVREKLLGANHLKEDGRQGVLRAQVRTRLEPRQGRPQRLPYRGGDASRPT